MSGMGGKDTEEIPEPKCHLPGTFPWALMGFLDCMGARMEAY